MEAVTKSRDHHLALKPLRGVNEVPMTALAQLLEKWDAALRSAVPQMVEHMDVSGAVAAALISQLEPVAVAQSQGSYKQTWGIGVQPASDIDVLMSISQETLDSMALTFESGVANLERGDVAPWMTAKVAKPLLDSVSGLSKRGIRITLVGANTTLAENATRTLREFIAQDERSKESEIQLLGVVTSVNAKHGYLRIDSAGHGNVRVALAKADKGEICQALAKGTLVQVSVSAILTSARTLDGAKLRSFKVLAERPNYRTMFAELWGTARDIFEGLPLDERGVPEIDVDDNKDDPA